MTESGMAARSRKLGAGGWKLVFLALVASCSGAVAPVQPSAGESPAAATTPIREIAQGTPASSPATGEATLTQEPCQADARFLEDLTIPDGSIVTPGEEIDKRWAVENAGTCDWGPGYALVRVSNDELSGPAEIDLYPARAGTRAVWQVVFLAPLIPGQYVSEWQAQAPDGTRFGEEVFVDLVVQPGS
jgi:hypothetical protein